MAQGPLPCALHTWQQQHIEQHDREPKHYGQWLVCLKGTQVGNRFVIVEAAGRGLVAVVDFDSTSQAVGSRYYAWGAVSYLRSPIGFDRLRAEGVFEERRGTDWRWIRGRPKILTDDERARIHALAESWPAVRKPTRRPTGRDGIEIWPMTGGLPPEKAIQDAVASNRRLWRAVGFSVRPAVEVPISSESRPDLMTPGVVGEVKNRLSHAWGPTQMERYLETLEHTQPEHAPWRGVLLHGEETLAPAVRARLATSRYAGRISVYGILPGRLQRLREWRAPIPQYP